MLYPIWMTNENFESRALKRNDTISSFHREIRLNISTIVSSGYMPFLITCTLPQLGLQAHTFSTSSFIYKWYIMREKLFHFYWHYQYYRSIILLICCSCLFGAVIRRITVYTRKHCFPTVFLHYSHKRKQKPIVI